MYQQMPGVGVHTRSPCDTAWAARREPIPCVLTAIADEFGGDIPVGPFAHIGADEMGARVVQTLAEHRSPAVPMANHGVFVVGRTARDALNDVSATSTLACASPS